MNKKLLSLAIMTIITVATLPSCSSGTEEEIVPPQQTQTPATPPYQTPDIPEQTQEPPQTIQPTTPPTESIDEIIYGDSTYNNGIVSLSQAGTMIQLLGEKYLEIPTLKIIGPINSSDIFYLREMCSEFGKLRNLDMEDATIIEGGLPYLGDKITSNYSIGAEMFYNSHLRSIILPKNIYIIEDNAFKDCKELTTVHIPESCKLTSIDNYAFCGCYSLTYFPLPDKLISIGNGAFKDCQELTTVHIPERCELTTIDNYAFCGCYNLTYFSLPDKLISIGNGAFKGCTKLTTVHIPGNISCVGDSTFYGCRNITILIIGEGITSIGEYAFADCGRWIDSIIIPNSLETIKADAFYKTNGHLYTEFETWQKINLLNDFSSPINYGEGGYVGDLHYISNGEEIKELVIPEGTTHISKHTFIKCKLNSISIPGTVKTIEGGAFQQSYQLQSIIIQNGVESIGGDAFARCPSLTSVSIPESVTDIGPYAFCDCTSLTSVSIPESVTNIEHNAFHACENLKSVTLSGAINYIGYLAFSYCINLESIIIHDEIENIHDSAFRDCHKITNITFYSKMPPTGARNMQYCLKDQLSQIQILVPKDCSYNDYYNIFKGAEIIKMDN